MPKNSRPKGGRPSRNFDPRYAGKKQNRFAPNTDARGAGGRGRDADDASGSRNEWAPKGHNRTRSAGSGQAGLRSDNRSPKHRGYRAPEAASGRAGADGGGRDGAPKRRWTAQERAGRDESRSIRDRAHGRRDDRPQRDDRGGYDRNDRSHDRNDRSYDRNRDDRGFQQRDDRPRRDDRGFGRRDDRAQPGRRDDRGFDRRDDRGFGNRRDDRQRGDRFGSSDRRDNRDFSDRDSARGRDEHRGGFGSRDAGRREHHRRDDRSENRGYTDRRDDRPRRDDRGAAGPRPSRSDWNPQPKAQTEDVVHERLRAETVEATVAEGATFADLGLGSNIVEVLSNMGAASPFPIQAASIPTVLAGRDVLGRGRTGSGKTIAFGAPLVERILLSQKGSKREYGRSPRAIILAPTRELALQIDRTVQPIARSVGLFTTQIYGGVPQARQVGALKKGVDIVIGTPGRIEDLIEQGKLDLSDVRIAVLDEADHMCELGFVEPVQRILRKTGEGSQKLLFSATLDREVAALVDEFLVDPAVYEVAGEGQETGTIDHRVLVIDHRDKAEMLASLVDRDGRTLVFSRTRAYAEMLAEQFADAGIPAVALHGDLNQAKRTRNLQKLTAGKVSVLVATDVAARGIHVDDIDLVVQADAPDEYKTYLHRAGRTGRAGNSGRVVTLVAKQRQRRMRELLDRAEIDAPFEPARPGDEIVEEIAGRVPTAQELTD